MTVYSDLREACMDGDLELVRRLCSLPGVDPTAKKNLAVRMASLGGHVEVVRYLYEVCKVDPTYEYLCVIDPVADANAVQMASMYGHLEVVKYLG